MGTKSTDAAARRRAAWVASQLERTRTSADRWRDNTDGTAWLVSPHGYHETTELYPLMACKGCWGSGSVPVELDDDSNAAWCPYCDGTGRHTFTVNSIRVHVEPGHVLPIFIDDEPHDANAPHVCYHDGYLFPMPYGDDAVDGFPMPAARPGMWAVKLVIHP